MSVPQSNRVRALVVDDEMLARQRLRAMLANETDIELIGEADGGSSAVEAIANMRPQLVFLDVQMPGLDGFGVLRCTAGLHRPVVVFVTAHDEHALRAFDVQAADYLLKPISTARLHEAVRRAVERVRLLPGDVNARAIDAVLAHAPATLPAVARISIKTADGTLLVNVSEIDWIEASGDYLQLHSGTSAREIRETMNEFEQRVAQFAFVRVHRSAIVNCAAVRAVEPIAKGDYYLVLRSGARVRSGRRYRDVVQELMR